MKKVEEVPVWSNPNVHVWKSKVNELTVVNLRDANERLSLSLSSTPPPTESEPNEEPPALANPRPINDKQEKLNAMLLKLQSSRPSEPIKLPLGISERPSAFLSASPSRPPQGVAPVGNHDPVFPDPKNNSASPGNFEFITGTNLPGQAVVVNERSKDGVQSFALFHDPLWGNVTDDFLSPSLSKSGTTPAAQSTHEAPSKPMSFNLSPAPMPTVTATAAATTAPPEMPSHPRVAVMPQPNYALGGLMTAPSPQASAPYPMYTIPMSYMAQPTFDASLLGLNHMQYYPYSGTPFAMAQAPPTAMMGTQIMVPAIPRPGTNVKAAPFVPGGGGVM